MPNTNNTNNNVAPDTVDLTPDLIELTPERADFLKKGLDELSQISEPMSAIERSDMEQSTYAELFLDHTGTGILVDIPKFRGKVFKLLKLISEDENSSAYEMFDKLGLKGGIDKLLDDPSLLNSKVKSFEEIVSEHLPSLLKDVPAPKRIILENEMFRLSNTDLLIRHEELFSRFKDINEFIVTNQNLIGYGAKFVGAGLLYRAVMKGYRNTAFPSHHIGKLQNITTRSKEARLFAIGAAPVIVVFIMGLSILLPKPEILVSFEVKDNIQSLTDVSQSLIPIVVTGYNKLPNWFKKSLRFILFYLIPISLFILLIYYYPFILIYIQSIQLSSLKLFTLFWMLLFVLYRFIHFSILLYFTQNHWNDKTISLSKFTNYLPNVLKSEIIHLSEVSKFKNDFWFIETDLRILIIYTTVFILYIIFAYVLIY